MGDVYDDDSLTTPVEGAAEASAAEGSTSPAVGRDEWVARHGEQRRPARRVVGTVEERLRTVPWWAWLTPRSSAVIALCRSASRAATSGASPSTPSSTCCSRSA